MRNFRGLIHTALSRTRLLPTTYGRLFDALATRSPRHATSTKRHFLNHPVAQKLANTSPDDDRNYNVSVEVHCCSELSGQYAWFTLKQDEGQGVQTDREA